MPTKSEAKTRIGRYLEQIPELMNLEPRSPEFQRWLRNTQVAISNTFGTNPENRQNFDEISYHPIMAFSGMSNSVYVSAYCNGLTRAKALLESMLDEIEDYWPDDNPQEPISEGQVMPEQRVSNRVFVVHGRDGGTRDRVARFLETLQLEVVVLQERASEGRTIIEKFEDYSDAGFAVVLCTPDDVGALASEKDNNLRPRPRQNVILELGYFWGKLGRKRVCALLDGKMDMPSDYDGVLFIPLDDGEGWKLILARELRAAGLPIDMNLIV